MTYSVPRPVYEKLAETLQDRKIADEFAGSIEAAVNALETRIQSETVEKIAVVKQEVKEDLGRTLVTRELFESRLTALQSHTDQRFEAVDIRFGAMQNYMDQRFSSSQAHMDERFKRMELWFKLLVGIGLFGITLANPGFIELLKRLFA